MLLLDTCSTLLQISNLGQKKRQAAQILVKEFALLWACLGMCESEWEGEVKRLPACVRQLQLGGKKGRKEGMRLFVNILYE